MSGGRRVDSLEHPGVGEDPAAHGERRGQRAGLARGTHSALLRGRSGKQVISPLSNFISSSLAVLYQYPHHIKSLKNQGFHIKKPYFWQG